MCINKQTLPDGEVLTLMYAANSLLSTLTSSLNTTLVSGVQYNALNLPTSYVLGNSPSATMQHTYVGLDGPGSPFGALKTTQWQSDASPRLVDRTLCYDPVGNVTQIADAVAGETITYGYDDLDRLLRASAPAGETYTYDYIGNIATKNGNSYSYQNSAHKHAVTATSPNTYAYNANGSLTMRNNQSISYDPLRRPVRSDIGTLSCVGSPTTETTFATSGSTRAARCTTWTATNATSAMDRPPPRW